MKKTICMLLCLLMVISCCACGGNSGNETTGGTTFGAGVYTIEVKNQAESPVTDVGVYVYTDDTRTDLVWFARTDASGAVSFEYQAAENFVIVLQGVPAGYKVEESYTVTGETTRIVLESEMAEVDDLTGVSYSKGDVMGDFSVTAPDGTVYTLSELLAGKKAVVLNFWYLECQPCKSEFPYLQEAYALYGDQIAVLAMNPVNTDDAEIGAYQTDNGITFPMVKCDPAWAEAMGLTAYPTTVVIDSCGVITLVHTGAVSSTEEFVGLLADYVEVGEVTETDPTEPDPTEDVTTAPTEKEDPVTEPTDKKDDPTTAPTENTQTPSTAPTEGKEDDTTTAPTISASEAAKLMEGNPRDTGLSDFELVVVPGYEAEVNIWKVTTKMYLTVSGNNAYVIYNNKTYTAKNGKVTLTISVSMLGAPVNIKVGTTGDTTETYQVKFSLPKGSWSNPYTMETGEEFEVNIAAGSEQGVYYTYTATESGTLTLECKECTAGVTYSMSIQLQNENNTVQTTLQEGENSITITVKKGQKFMINFGTVTKDFSYPAATLKMLATLETN